MYIRPICFARKMTNLRDEKKNLGQKNFTDFYKI